MTMSSDPTPTDPIERAAQVRRVLNDPGAITPRLRPDDRYELVTDWQVRALSAAGLLAAAPAEDAVDRARRIIADHCFGPHASRAGEERALDIAGACTDDMADEGLFASSLAPADDEAAIEPTGVRDDGARWAMPADLRETFTSVASWRDDDGTTGVGIETWLTQHNITSSEGRAMAARLVAAADHADAALAALTAEHERAEGWHNSYQTMRAERDQARSQVDRTFTETRGQIVEMARGNAAAMNEVRAERDRLRLAWLSAARGRMRARIERDTLGEQIEPYGECDPACDCGDHQGRSCGCHVTGEEARTWLRQQDIELDQLRADLKARTAERDRAQALLAEIGYGEDHSWRITEVTAERDEAIKAVQETGANYLRDVADLRTRLSAALSEIQRWRSTVPSVDQDTGQPGARSVVAVMPADLEDQLRFVLEETPYIGEWPDHGGLRVDEAYAAKKLAEKIAEWCVATPDTEPAGEDAAVAKAKRHVCPICGHKFGDHPKVHGSLYCPDPSSSLPPNRGPAAEPAAAAEAYARIAATGTCGGCGTDGLKCSDCPPAAPDAGPTGTFKIGDHVEFQHAPFAEPRTGHVSNLTPLRIMADDTGNRNTEPMFVRLLDHDHQCLACTQMIEWYGDRAAHLIPPHEGCVTGLAAESADQVIPTSPAAAPVEAETPAPPTHYRDRVVEEFVATWDGVDRTPLPEYPDISGGGAPYPAYRYQDEPNRVLLSPAPAAQPEPQADAEAIELTLALRERAGLDHADDCDGTCTRPGAVPCWTDEITPASSGTGTEADETEESMSIQIGTRILLDDDAMFTGPGTPLSLTPERARELATKALDGLEDTE